MGGIAHAIKKVVSSVGHFLGGGSRADVPDVHVENPAPAINAPIEEPTNPEMGADSQESAETKRRKGKRGLKIDLNTTRGTSGTGVGLNIPR